MQDVSLQVVTSHLLEFSADVEATDSAGRRYEDSACLESLGFGVSCWIWSGRVSGSRVVGFGDWCLSHLKPSQLGNPKSLDCRRLCGRDARTLDNSAVLTDSNLQNPGNPKPQNPNPETPKIERTKSDCEGPSASEKGRKPQIKKHNPGHPAHPSRSTGKERQTTATTTLNP